jgi:hypothetical protein
MIRQEIRRLFHSPFLYLSILVLLFGSILPTFDCLADSIDIVYLLDVTGVGYGMALIPILSCLAVADSYLIEYQSGYHYAVMSRTTKLKYCFSKLGVAAASGIFVVLVMKLLLIAILVASVWYLHGEVVFGGEEAIDCIGTGSILILRRQFGLFIGQNILYDCLYAAIFPALSLAVSTLIKNKYVVMLFPFIYANVTTFIFVGLKWYYLAPMVLGTEGRASLLPHEGLPYRIIVVLIYWAVSAVWFVRGVWKETK